MRASFLLFTIKIFSLPFLSTFPAVALSQYLRVLTVPFWLSNAIFNLAFFSTIRELVEPLRGFGDADSDSQLTYRRSQPPRTEQSMSLSGNQVCVSIYILFQDWNPEEFVGADKLASHSISHSMPSTERERLKRVNKDVISSSEI